MFIMCMTWYNMFTFKKIYAHNYTHTHINERNWVLIKINNKSCNIKVKLVHRCSRCLCSHWNNLTTEFIYTIIENFKIYFKVKMSCQNLESSVVFVDKKEEFMKTGDIGSFWGKLVGSGGGRTHSYIIYILPLKFCNK